MKNYYKTMKIFSIIAFVLIAVIFIPVIAVNIAEHRWGSVFLSIPIIVGMAAIAGFLLVYYRNVVIDVAFDGDMTVITTNVKTLCLPSKNFVEVVDSGSRIYLRYDDGTFRKRFIFQKKYSPFHSYSPDMAEMRKNMIHAVFRKG